MMHRLMSPLLLGKALTLAVLAVMTAFALVPSQVPGVRHGATSKSDGNATATAAWHGRPAAVDDAAAGDRDVGRARDEVATRKRLATPRTGNLPDVHWRAIPMADLRRHPHFRPLPPPSEISALPTKEHVRHFRQDSWQWDYLHAGRCTTSQAAAALGFLEPRAAAALGIPPSLRRGGTGAWERLRQAPMEDDLEMWQQVLCDGLDQGEAGRGRVPGVPATAWPWIPAAKLRRPARATRPFPFVAKYVPKVTNEELHKRKVLAQGTQADHSPLSARMQWGNAQEATAILTALNHFCSVDKDATIHEVGMCGASYSHPLLNGLTIGATPDAMIVHGNGTVEVLEVKNHCPFAWIGTSKGKKGMKDPREGSAGDRYVVRDFQVEHRVPAAYIPQIMMEMLCVGDTFDLDNPSGATATAPACGSAVMVRQTATKGSLLLRLRRDEEWIREMLHWLGKFQTSFVETGRLPPDNFFWDEDPNSRYRRFLQRTRELSESVEQVAFVDSKMVQRRVPEGGFSLNPLIPLFLDDIEKED